MNEIAERKKELVTCVMCVSGVKKGKYTMQLCASELMERRLKRLMFESVGTREEFQLITSTHIYSISLKESTKIADDVGIANATFD